MRGAVPLPLRHWQGVIICRRGISSRCCRRWSARASSRASAGRAAATNWREDQGKITADEILRAAGAAEEGGEGPLADSALLSKVVVPALAQAEKAFSAALSRISVADLTHSAEGLRKAGT